MSPRRLRLRLFLATAAAVLAIATVPAGPASAATDANANANAVSYVALNGDGSSWAQPAIQQWARDMAPPLAISYTGDGSAQGREKFMLQQNDFAGSDIAFLKQGDPFGAGVETPAWNYSYVPIVAGGTTFIYNLTVAGHKITNLRLSGQTIAEIFTGRIQNWDDQRITKDYGAKLPNEPITVVTRSDGSGASYMFTRWLSKEYPSLWNSFCAAHGGPNPCGPTEFYPGFGNSQQKNGSDQMASFLASSDSNGAIGYDEYAYALDNNLPAVKMLNAAGYYTLPTPSNVAIALQQALIDENPADVDFLMQNLDKVYTFTDPRTYPLSSYSYLVIPRDVGGGGNHEVQPDWTTAKGQTLSTWLNYVLCGAQNSAGNLGYSPLPKNLVSGGFTQVAHLPGHVAIPNLNSCNNPTFRNNENLLIKDAPMPSPCDFHTAPLNCVVSGGKAHSSGSGSGSGGSGGSGAGNANAANPGVTGPGTGSSATSGAGGGQSAGPGSGSGPGSDSGSGNAQSIDGVPVALANRPNGQSLLAALTVLEILAAVAAPVAVAAWLQRRRKQG